MTILDVINFVHEVRKTKPHTMLNWTDGSIAIAVESAVMRDNFGWVTREGRLTGFAFGFERAHEKVFDVTQVVGESPRDLAHLMLLFKQRFPDWTLRGFRRKKSNSKNLVDYKRVDRFVHLTQVTASTYAKPI